MAQDTKTKPSVWTAVFRLIVERVKGDREIRRVVGVDNVRSWDGSSGDKNPMNPTAGPIIRLTPQPGNVSWYDPSSQSGTLAVRVEIAVQTLNVDNVVDVWDLLVTALNPGDLTFCQSLVAAGAITGEIVFGQPAFTPQPEASPEGYFLAEGRFSLDVGRSVLS